MDILDQALETSSQENAADSEAAKVTIQEEGGGDGAVPGDEQAVAIATQVGAIGGDAGNLQYQFRTDSNGQGQVTYRVVHMSDGTEATAAAVPSTVNVVTTSSFPSAQLETGIQGGFNNGSSPTTDNQAGQFYVMMSPQDVLQGASPRSIAPRSTGKMDSSRGHRDERRRATHNEVERRRRDKINNWIVKISKIVPECAADHTKQGQSKGGILSKTCDYIDELRTANNQMSERLKEIERMAIEMDLLRQQIDELKQENALLQAQLSQHGIDSLGSS